MSYNKQHFVDGKILTANHLNTIEDGIVNNEASLQNKQDTLISGVTIKTINGESLLGEGNISISGGSSSGGALSTITVSASGIDYDATMKTINHRGYSSAPENTIPAYIYSKRKGYKYVECDIQFTKDGIPVLLHDTTIDRTSDGSGNVADFTYEQLLLYDFGSWKSPNYIGTRIPTFAEFMACCKGLGLYPYVEIESGVTQERAQLVVDIVKDYGMLEFTSFISFGLDALQKIVAVYPKARVGFISSSTNIEDYNSLRTDENNEVFVDAGVATDALVAFCKENNLPLEVWNTSVSAIADINPYVTGVTLDNNHAGQILYNKQNTYLFDSNNDGINDSNIPKGTFKQYNDASLWLPGYVNGNGTIHTPTSSGERYYNQLLAVKEGEVVILGNTDFTWTSSWLGFEFYSNQNTAMKRIDNSTHMTKDGLFTMFEVPEGANFVKISSRNMEEDYYKTAVIYIGEAVLPDPEVIYTITSNLINVRTDNATSEIVSGKQYIATLTAIANHEISSIVVTMNGIDVTSKVLTRSKINIQEVTGDVVITASAVMVETPSEPEEPEVTEFPVDERRPDSITPETHIALTDLEWIDGYTSGANSIYSISTPSNNEKTIRYGLPVNEGTQVVIGNTDETWDSGWTAVEWFGVDRKTIKRDNGFKYVESDGKYVIYTAPAGAVLCLVSSRNMVGFDDTAVIYISKDVEAISPTPSGKFFNVYKNLEFENGYISSGSPSSNTGNGEMRTVDFLPIEPGKFVSIGNEDYGWNNNQWSSFTFYNIDKTYLSGPTIASIYESDGSWKGVIAPNNAAFVKISSRKLGTNDSYLRAIVYIEI